MTTISSNDQGDGYFIKNNDSTQFIISKFTSSSSSFTKVLTLNSDSDIAVPQITVNISIQTKDKIWFVYKGVLFYRDGEAATPCTDMYSCEKLSLELDVLLSRVSVGRYNTPWVIGSNGNLYNAECNLPYQYWDQSTLSCVSTCPNGTFYYLNKCVLKCEALTVQEGTYCVNCKLKNPQQYFYNGKCETTIPVKTMIRNESFNERIVCSENNPPYFIYGNDCVATCPKWFLTKYNEYDCLDYKKINLYVYNGYLVNTCPSSNNLYLDTADNFCKLCIEMIDPISNEYCILSGLSEVNFSDPEAVKKSQELLGIYCLTLIIKYSLL